MLYFLSSVFCVALLATTAVSDNGNNCTIFSVNGSTPSYFTYHRFYDFRNIHSTINLLTNSSDPTAFPTSKSINDTSWTDDWEVKVESKPAVNDNTIAMQYIAANVYIENSTDSSPDYITYLTLATTRQTSTQQLAAEIDFAQTTSISHISLRLLARVAGPPGAVAGFFTYHNDTTESDIEILTRDSPHNIHYSNQPTTNPDTDAAIAGSTFNISMPGGARWTEWNVHRLDWLGAESAWYVDGVRVAGTGVNVPGAGSAVILNMWGNGGAWAGAGGMAVGGWAAVQVQWIEMVFNVSGEAGGSSANAVVCSVDQVVGMPTVAQNVAVGGRRSRALLLLSVLLTAWMAFV